MLIIRDPFFVMRRFGDFTAHLDVPRVVGTKRLHALVHSISLFEVFDEGGRRECLAKAGPEDLWPAL
ncbi:hypothetical protein [Mycobacterium vicinigordonae]|uniref:Uncharacterized protein n=1 Tax=Mycobacterium vicinigordonae TaxID=1719132 RepID=A0A7D6IKE9_9MYCO|nr:hypothetical protein [Mycobacterium vicinigordonae]QLL06260.1 hypothetical protein H0P51_21225 [Mycobacterium vicinigordonae]